jgi:RNA polymerase sigma-70 factor (ECF subfamily)
VERCRRGEPKAQELLYRKFYGYALTVCRRYSRSHEEAIEILNDGFFKVMTRLDKYTPGLSFKGWIRRIMVNSAIDHFRAHEKHYNNIDISYIKTDDIAPDVWGQLSEEVILKAIQQLPPSYQMVFNLHAIEGYGHEEIAQKLGISVGTSKSNLSVARAKLMKLLGNEFDQTKIKNG